MPEHALVFLVKETVKTSPWPLHFSYYSLWFAYPFRSGLYEEYFLTKAEKGK